MKRFYEVFSILAALSLFVSSCEIPVIPAQTDKQPVQKSVSYDVVLGKSMTEKAVNDFIVKNHCSPADQFQLCKEIGMALWTDSDQIVRIIYLYAGDADGFKRYQGTLPFALSFYDPMWRVQQKLSNVDEDGSVQDVGLPDEASSPDHMHYWANYKRFGITIIYNAPFADEDAYIYAILVT